MKTTLEELGVKRYDCTTVDVPFCDEPTQEGSMELSKNGDYLDASEIESLLSEGKLVKPMSVESIEKVLARFYGSTSADDDMPTRISEAIYTAQFERTEK